MAAVAGYSGETETAGGDPTGTTGSETEPATDTTAAITETTTESTGTEHTEGSTTASELESTSVVPGEVIEGGNLATVAREVLHDTHIPSSSP